MGWIERTKFNIGDNLRAYDDRLFFDAKGAPSSLQSGDGAFVRGRSDEIDGSPSSGGRSWNWKYAVVVAVEHTASPPHILFQVSLEGAVLIIEEPEWRDRVRLVRKSCCAHHPTIPFHATNAVDEGEHIALQSITAMPIYAGLSFEELRLKNYSENNFGSSPGDTLYDIACDRHAHKAYKKWGGSDLNRFLEADLGTKRVLLKRPKPGGIGMYTKKQSLHIINTATLKASRERGSLIRLLAFNKLVPSARALYRLIQRSEKGLPIHNNDWGLQVKLTEDAEEEDTIASRVKRRRGDEDPIMIAWDSEQDDSELLARWERWEPSPHVPKKRAVIGDKVMAESSYARWGLMNEKGWKGQIRLRVYPVDIDDISNPGYHLSFLSVCQLNDICSYIGGSDLFHGREFDRERFHQSEKRICRLYFDRRAYPPPAQLSEGGSCPMFVELKNYIRRNAKIDRSPVICNGGKDHKRFTCNKHYTDRTGKRRKCPFGFQVRWDEYGYYIHLLDSKAQKNIHCCGQAWHCCKPKC